MPRLESLKISNFRSIAGHSIVPLDADVVLLHGINGAGKTSILSAIELAATGRIAHLHNAGGKDYFRQLVHRGRDSGEVQLTASGIEPLGATGIRFDSVGISGSAGLSSAQASFFSDRCFLPQTTLGRLLEIYAPGEPAGAESSLVSFVKALVGLDSLDALIQGLDASGHIARAQRLSSSWSVAQLQLKNLDVQRKGAERAQSAAARALKEAQAALRSVLSADKSMIGSQQLVDLAQARLEQLRLTGDENLRGIDLELQALIETAKELPSAELKQPKGSEALESELFRWWTEGDGRFLTDQGSDAASAVGIERWTSETAIALFSATTQMLQEAIQELDAWGVTRVAMLANRDAGLAQSKLLSSSIESQAEARRQLQVTSDMQALTELLAIALPLVDGDHCPLCDQKFPGGGNALAAHIAEKVDRLSADATRSLDIERTLRGLEQQHAKALADVKSASDALAVTPDEDVLRDRRASLEQAQAVMRRLRPLVEHANQLIAAIDGARALEAQRLRGRDLERQIRARAADISNRLRVLVHSEDLTAQLQALDGELTQQLNDLDSNATDAIKIESALVGLWEAMRTHSDATSDLGVLEATRLVLDRQVTEASRRKDSASSLRREAERVRSAAMRGVFDDNLNRIWGDLFRRLAPLEPFVPRFKHDDRASRTVNIELETVDRQGLAAASPATMLSYGNVNTAALSLFLSLHFAVEPVLPWLILDDPIQSMDDIHVSNFAALLKQLSRNRGRQVIVAVHQRELFDYLKLELTPASRGQQLLALSIERLEDGDTKILDERITYEADESIRAAS